LTKLECVRPGPVAKVGTVRSNWLWLPLKQGKDVFKHDVKAFVVSSRVSAIETILMLPESKQIMKKRLCDQAGAVGQ